MRQADKPDATPFTSRSRARDLQQRVLVFALALLFALVCPQGAFADAVTVVLRNGGQAQGELVEHVPGDHLTIGQADGQIVRIENQDIVSIQMGPPSAQVAPPPYPVQAPPPAPYQSAAPPPYGVQPYGYGAPVGGNNAMLLLDPTMGVPVSSALAK